MEPRKWTKREDRLIRFAIQRIFKGASIYSQVKRLKVKPGALEYRSWESIRSKIYRKRIQYNKYKLIIQEMISSALVDIRGRRKRLMDDIENIQSLNPAKTLVVGDAIDNLPEDFEMPESFEVQ